MAEESLTDMQWAQREGIKQARESIRMLLQTAMLMAPKHQQAGLARAVEIVVRLEEGFDG